MIEKKQKIIMLSFFGPNKSSNHPKPGSDNYFFASWAGLIAKRLKAFDPQLDIEVWRAEPDFKNINYRKAFNVDAYIFPYQFPIIKRVLTFQMLFRLKSLAKKYNLIIHYHSVFDRFTIFAPWLIPKAHFVFSHHGGLPPNNDTFKGKIKVFLIKKTYNKVKFISYLNEKTKIYLKNLGLSSKIGFLPVGADFEQFKPMDKKKVRKLLKLDENKIYAIYVGTLYRLKGVDLILDVYEQLKKKYNFSVIFVGSVCDEEHDIYERVKSSECIFFGPQPWYKMKLYYNAADFYIHPVFNPIVGFDVSLLEAIASNIPVVSARLESFEIPYNEFGVFVNSPEDLLVKTEYMINNFIKYTNVRHKSIKHFNANTSISKKIIGIYQNVTES